MRLDGAMWWIDPRKPEADLSGTLLEFVLSPERISFEVNVDQRRYWGTLQRTGEHYGGQIKFSGGKGDTAGKGHASSCTLSPHEDGYTLRGDWHQEDHPGIKFEWRGELKSVDTS